MISNQVLKELAILVHTDHIIFLSNYTISKGFQLFSFAAVHLLSTLPQSTEN